VTVLISDSQGIELLNDVVLEKYKHNPDSQIEYDGRTYYSLEKFGELCWYEGKHAHQVYDRKYIVF
jgi:hypothetical protein